VVPCCVYSAAFSPRRLRDGTLVRTYEQLCDYLQEKHPAIRRAALGFEGKNVCLYHLHEGV